PGGTMAYSAATQPWPCPRMNGGTPSGTVAVQTTRVDPASIRHEPSAGGRKPGTIRIGRSVPAERPSGRAFFPPSTILTNRPIIDALGAWHGGKPHTTRPGTPPWRGTRKGGGAGAA